MALERTAESIQRDSVNFDENGAHPGIFSSRNVFKFLTIVFELALIIATMYLFQIERDHAFLRLLPSLFLGFILFNVIPLRFRLIFLFLLSVVTFTFIVGFRNTVLIITIGSGLLLICHLPIPYFARVVAVLFVGGLLAVININWIETSWGNAVIPLVASMFMFRLILYLYELGQKDQEPASVWHRLCYFFLLPNICFPLFPIVDYKTYLRSYLNDDPLKIFQKGISWMFRGVTQLILYRIIYFLWTPSPAEVVNASSLVVYFLTSYMLLLKISGQAHLIIGILCLFGFNLPPIFNKYFLAEGFNDLWRRINIYWKDFVMKIFYYRIFFVFRKWGLKVATAITLLFIFFITWMLHSYQYFWLEARFPITKVDGLFWSIFGVLIAINSLVQMKQKGRKSLGVQRWSFTEAAKKSFHIVSFFIFMCILWSLWQSGSIPEWLSTVSAVREIKITEAGVIALVILSVIIVGAWIQYPFSKLSNVRTPSFYRSAVVIIVAASAILTFRMYRDFNPENKKLARFVDSIKEPKLNRKDSDRGERGYYGTLLGTERLTNEFYQGVDLRPPDWQGLNVSHEAVRPVDNILLKELLPSVDLMFKGARFTTNKWGLRDQDYELRKPPSTYRFAIVGSSIEMGAGVNDHDVFESLVEERLNKNNKKELYSKYEILNFAAGGYDLANNVKVIEEKVFKFEPDAVIYFAHTNQRWTTADRFLEIINSGVDLEYDFLKDIKKRAGLQQGMNNVESMKRLLPYANEIQHWAYRRIVEKCHQNNSVPVWVLLPHLRQAVLMKEVDENDRSLIATAKSLGFVVMDLSKVYHNHDIKFLVVSSWDAHPNKEGHRLVANLLYNKIVENQDALHLGIRE